MYLGKVFKNPVHLHTQNNQHPQHMLLDKYENETVAEVHIFF